LRGHLGVARKQWPVDEEPPPMTRDVCRTELANGRPVAGPRRYQAAPARPGVPIQRIPRGRG